MTTLKAEKRDMSTKAKKLRRQRNRRLHSGEDGQERRRTFHEDLHQG